MRERSVNVGWEYELGELFSATVHPRRMDYRHNWSSAQVEQGAIDRRDRSETIQGYQQ